MLCGPDALSMGFRWAAAEISKKQPKTRSRSFQNGDNMVPKWVLRLSGPPWDPSCHLTGFPTPLLNPFWLPFGSHFGFRVAPISGHVFCDIFNKAPGNLLGAGQTDFGAVLGPLGDHSGAFSRVSKPVYAENILFTIL